jgi:hypothetical protein
MRRPRLALLAALLCAALTAGCGGGSGTSSSAGRSSAGAATGSSAAVPGSPEIKTAVAKCRHTIAAQRKLPSRSRAKLESACAAAARGDTAAVKVVAREVCEEAIEAASLPASTKQAALGACRR